MELTLISQCWQEFNSNSEIIGGKQIRFFFLENNVPHLSSLTAPTFTSLPTSLTIIPKLQWQPPNGQIKDSFQSLSYLIFSPSLYCELLEDGNHVFIIVMCPFPSREQACNEGSVLSFYWAGLKHSASMTAFPQS